MEGPAYNDKCHNPSEGPFTGGAGAHQMPPPLKSPAPPPALPPTQAITIIQTTGNNTTQVKTIPAGLNASPFSPASPITPQHQRTNPLRLGNVIRFLIFAMSLVFFALLNSGAYGPKLVSSNINHIRPDMGSDISGNGHPIDSLLGNHTRQDQQVSQDVPINKTVSVTEHPPTSNPTTSPPPAISSRGLADGDFLARIDKSVEAVKVNNANGGTGEGKKGKRPSVDPFSAQEHLIGWLNSEEDDALLMHEKENKNNNQNKNDGTSLSFENALTSELCTFGGGRNDSNIDKAILSLWGEQEEARLAERHRSDEAFFGSLTDNRDRKAFRSFKNKLLDSGSGGRKISPAFGTFAPMPPVAFTKIISAGSVPVTSVCLDSGHPFHIVALLPPRVTSETKPSSGNGGNSTQATNDVIYASNLSPYDASSSKFILSESYDIYGESSARNVLNASPSVDGSDASQRKDGISSPDFDFVRKVIRDSRRNFTDIPLRGDIPLTLRTQIGLLVDESPGYGVDNALVTLMMDVTSPSDTLASSMPPGHRRIAFAVVRYNEHLKRSTSNRRPAEWFISGVVDVPSNSKSTGYVFNHIRKMAVGRDETIVRAMTKNQFPTGKGNSGPASDHGSIPHAVFDLPRGAFLLSRNVRALCLLDTVVNDESEAIASYPFPKTYGRRHKTRSDSNDTSERTLVADGPFVDSSRKFVRNGRLTVGFVHISTSDDRSAASILDRSPNSEAYSVNFSLSGHQTPDDTVTVISSCRPPIRLTASSFTMKNNNPSSLNSLLPLSIDGRHYTKGGDFVMLGTWWSLDVSKALRRNMIFKQKDFSSQQSSSTTLPSQLEPRSIMMPFMATGAMEDLFMGTPSIIHTIPNRMENDRDTNARMVRNGKSKLGEKQSSIPPAFPRPAKPYFSLTTESEDRFLYTNNGVINGPKTLQNLPFDRTYRSRILNSGERASIFELTRKPIDTHCSADPMNPVRVSTYMAMYVDMKTLAAPRNPFDVLIRTMNASALITAHSDLIVATNIKSDDWLKIARADARGLSADYYFRHQDKYSALMANLEKTANAETHPRGGGSSSDIVSGEIPQREYFLDHRFGSPLGEFIILTFRRHSLDHWMCLASNALLPLMSQVGFHDFVRYTEDDVYLSRDQFEHWCATLPFLESREEHFNHLRFEAFSPDLDESGEAPSPSPLSLAHLNGRRKPPTAARRHQIGVLQRRLPKLIVLPDRRIETMRWPENVSAYAIDVRLAPVAPTTSSTNDLFSDYNDFLSKYPLHGERRNASFTTPISPTLSIYNRLLSSVYYTPPREQRSEYDNQRKRIISSEDFHLLASSLHPPLQHDVNDQTRNTALYPIPTTPFEYTVRDIPLSECRFVGHSNSTNFASNTQSHVSGCYTFVRAVDKGWGMKRIYTAHWMVPTHRIQNFYMLGTKSKSVNFTSAMATEAQQRQMPALSSMNHSPVAAWKGLNVPFKFLNNVFYWNRYSGDAMMRESIVFFGETPLNSYRVGGVFNVFMEEGADLDAFKRKEWLWNFEHHQSLLLTLPRWGEEKEAQEKKGLVLTNQIEYFQPYGIHRLSCVHHGSNNKFGNEMAGFDHLQRIKIAKIKIPVGKYD